MKNYVEQFYNEGFATTFYLRPIKFIKKRIKNKNILKLSTIIVKVLYTVLILIFAAYMFYVKFPL